MKFARPGRRLVFLLVIIAGCLLWINSGSVWAGVIDGTLYFTTFNGPSVDRLHSVAFSYNSSGNAINFGAATNIFTDQGIGADGIIFANDGKTLLIGGQNAAIYHVDPGNGHVLNTLGTGGVDVFHIALSPAGNTVYGGGSEAGSAGLAVVPTNPYGNGIAEAISGSNSIITGIAFDKNGDAFYTASPAGGFGNFGTISNLSTFPVTHALVALTAAHGITYDPFTNDFVLVGGNEIAQVDTSGHVVSDRFFGGYGAAFDQASVDGQGHLFVTNNDGNLLFVDYSSSGLIGDSSDFTSKHFLADSLDDIAPLVGPGGGGLAATPEPSSLTLMSLGLAALGGYRWRRRMASNGAEVRGSISD